MAYTPKTWACDDTITADDLNHIEQGIANSGGGTEPLIVRSDTNNTLDKTWQEIKDAYDAGRAIICYYELATSNSTTYYSDCLTQMQELQEGGTFYYVTFGSNEYETNSADGYPTFGS